MVCRDIILFYNNNFLLRYKVISQKKILPMSETEKKCPSILLTESYSKKTIAPTLPVKYVPLGKKIVNQFKNMPQK